ncbi:hypothetical protein Salat_1020600 [Sesamum alatum]|uniref:Senescence regulator n=1 Tax=Sesamum alatum TaxID=300844 RepID=A0AAE1YLI6_9LAMI|nr:hypothetical protein Salat_1020600 [Sesamum alatum]
MDQNGVVSYRHRRSPSSDRFIGVFSPPSSNTTISSSPSAVAGDELNEDDVFYTNDFAEPRREPPSSINRRSSAHSFRQPEKFGILAALPEDKRNPDVIIQKPALHSSPTTSFSRDIPSIPKPHPPVEITYSQSMPIRRFQQSAPVNVPMMPRKPRNVELADLDAGDDMDEEVLPPHEIVARGSLRNEKTSFSVLEGVGRTLKGRDLRQVRNAVWRQTGFLD